MMRTHVMLTSICRLDDKVAEYRFVIKTCQIESVMPAVFYTYVTFDNSLLSVVTMDNGTELAVCETVSEVFDLINS